MWTSLKVGQLLGMISEALSQDPLPEWVSRPTQHTTVDRMLLCPEKTTKGPDGSSKLRYEGKLQEMWAENLNLSSARYESNVMLNIKVRGTLQAPVKAGEVIPGAGHTYDVSMSLEPGAPLKILKETIDSARHPETGSMKDKLDMSCDSFLRGRPTLPGDGGSFSTLQLGWTEIPGTSFHFTSGEAADHDWNRDPCRVEDLAGQSLTEADHTHVSGYKMGRTEAQVYLTFD